MPFSNKPYLIALGGGNGLAYFTAAIRKMGYRALIVNGNVDDGGSTGRLRECDPKLLPPGDGVKSFIRLLSTDPVFDDQDWNEILNVKRYSTVTELLPAVDNFLSLIQNVRPTAFTSSKLNIRQVIGDYVNFIELRTSLLLQDEYLQEATRAILKEKYSIGNILFASLQSHFNYNQTCVCKYLSENLGIFFPIEFAFVEPCVLQATALDLTLGEWVELYRERVIDTWKNGPIWSLKASTLEGKEPSLNPNLVDKLKSNALVVFAPGSRENYASCLTPDFVKEINNANCPVRLIAPLFQEEKDLPLPLVINEILKAGIANLRVSIPEKEYIESILNNTDILMKYVKEGKTFQFAYLRQFHEIIQTAMAKWVQDPELNELYIHYTRQLDDKRILPMSNEIEGIIDQNQKILNLDIDGEGLKHDPEKVTEYLEAEMLKISERERVFERFIAVR